MLREWIDANATRRGGAAYLEDAQGTGTLTYAELRRSVSAWARYLDRAGIPAGARIGVRVPDPLGYAAALVGILGAGRVAVPLDPGAPAAEVARMLAVARPVALVRDAPLGRPEGLTLLRLRGEHAPESCDGGGIFLCTSGTTGTPKGILLREDQLCHVAAGVAGHHGLTPADCGYCCLPLFHVNAEVVGLLATLCAGACLVLDRKFSRSGFWPRMDEREITWINAVPAIIALLAQEPAGARPPRRVRFVRSASAPLPPSTLGRFEVAFGIPVIETYGMTEAASMITANPLDGVRKAGSVGLPIGTELRVVQLAGDRASGGQPVSCPENVVGRVQIRGPGVITAYASGGRTAAIDPEGWLDTGDLGHLDEEGYLFLAGRSDDVINRGGEKIYPREIEDVLVAQRVVLSAAVVAAPDDVLGERPVAFVVPAGTMPPEQIRDALDEACEAALPRHKRPGAIFMVEELPLGPTGKVARHRLQAKVPMPSH
jgi:acyl-CoA synthetase (AMP-forming)/AMP-acid ligase II